jgi:hypothetical protein
MKRALTIPMVVLLAMPLLADDAQKATSAKSAGPAAAAPQTDSPMVQAMKRANRQGRKSGKVITNETLRTSKGGHVTTTTVQRSVNVPEPELSPAELEAMNVQKARQQQATVRQLGAAEAQKNSAERERRVAEKAERAEEGLYEGLDDDPAQTEHEADQAASPGKPPQR